MLNTTEALPELVSTGVGILLGGIVAAQAGSLALTAYAFRSTKVLEVANSFGPEQASNIARYAEQTVDYIHNNNIGSVALIDVSARPFAHSISLGWRRRFGSHNDATKRPPLFFINPQGFVNRSNFSPRTTTQTIINPLIRGGALEAPYRRRSAAVIQAELADQLPGLYARRDQPTLILDSCLHTGSTVVPLIKGLRTAGFKRLHFGVVHYKESDIYTPDLVLDTNIPIGGCYPFGVDKIIQKTYHTAHSRATNNPKGRRAGMQLRNNLYQALTSHYNTPPQE